MKYHLTGGFKEEKKSSLAFKCKEAVERNN